MTRIARVAVERGEDRRELVALGHRHDVERRPVEHDVGARCRHRLDAETVERARIARQMVGVMEFPALRLVVAGDQQPAQDLADRRFRNLGDEHIVARPLEIGERRGAAMRIERRRSPPRRGA